MRYVTLGLVLALALTIGNVGDQPETGPLPDAQAMGPSYEPHGLRLAMGPQYEPGGLRLAMGPQYEPHGLRLAMGPHYGRGS